jgi:hypothetical protein
MSRSCPGAIVEIEKVKRKPNPNIITVNNTEETRAVFRRQKAGELKIVSMARISNNAGWKITVHYENQKTSH